MLVRMLKPIDRLEVCGIGMLSFSLSKSGIEPKVLVTIEHETRGFFLFVGGAVLFLEQPLTTFSVLPNSWFKVQFVHSVPVGIKVFSTDKDGNTFSSDAIKVVADAPSEAEIIQC